MAYTTNEMLWLRYFNPLEEYGGLSPLAPARMSVDMGLEGLRFNRNFLRNSARPDFVLLTNDSMTDTEIEEFYNRWEARHRGPGNPNRPAIASFVRDIKTLGFSHRDMDFRQGLRWSLEEVSRVYGVPKPLLSDLERATIRQHQRLRAHLLAKHNAARARILGRAAQSDVVAPIRLSRSGSQVRRQ